MLYIMGTARSGSTILEIMLSKGRGCFGAGEISSLVQDGFLENRQCSCGKNCRDCEVWGRAFEDLGAAEDDLSSWAAVQKEMDWHDGFFRQATGMVGREAGQAYGKWNRRLLEVLKAKTGSEIIVDSSKYAGRALALQRVVGADVRVICLTRSPEGLMTSFAKANKDEQRPKKPLAALFYYVVTLASLRLAVVLLGRKNVFHLKYEDLVTDPEKTLDAIGKWSDVDFAESLLRLKEGLEFEVGHVVTGNRLRKKEKVQFRGMDERKVRGGLRERTAVAIMNCWRVMLRF